MAIFKDERIEGADIAIKQSDLMATILSLPVLLSRKRVRVCVFACARWCVTSLAYGSNGEPCWNIHNVTLSLQYLLWKTNIKPPELPTTLEPFSSAFSMWRQRHISLWLVALFECWRWAAELMCLHTEQARVCAQFYIKKKNEIRKNESFCLISCSAVKYWCILTPCSFLLSYFKLFL